MYLQYLYCKKRYINKGDLTKARMEAEQDTSCFNYSGRPTTLTVLNWDMQGIIDLQLT